MSTYFSDGTVLQDALSGATYTVSGGSVNVTLAARSGVVLLSETTAVDITPPTAAISISPAPTGSGWNNSAVTANLSATDAGSGVKELRYWLNSGGTTIVPGASASVNVSADNTTINLRAVDNVGNFSALVSTTVRIDTVAPVVTVTGVSDGAAYSPGSVPAADCTTADALSGVAVEATLTITGGNPDGTGTFTATCSGAVDNAANMADAVSVTYTVTQTFNFTGFFQPVDNTPTFNVVNAGRGIPVKFSLNGDQGLNILAAGYPLSQRITCPDSPAVDIVEQTVTASTSGLTYDAATDIYTYTWKTERSWAGTCRQLIVRLSDGTDHVALFRFIR